MTFAALKNVAVGVFMSVAVSVVSGYGQGLPKPELAFVRSFVVAENTREIRNYFFEIVNRDEFSDDLFVRTDELPPCGINPRASRTWLNFFDGDGNRIYGHCVINGKKQLELIGFGRPKEDEPPRSVYVEFYDRVTGETVRSNVVDTPRRQ